MKARALIAAALLLLAMSVGCASKPKAIQAGAVSFSTESLKSIEMLDELVVREVSSAIQDENVALDGFANQVIHEDTDLGRESLTRLMYQFKTRRDLVSAIWKDYLGDLRAAYIEYVQMFNSLDKGALFSSKQIEESIPITKKLTANMAALGNHWAKHQATFNTDFATLQDQLRSNREGTDTPEVKKLKAMAIHKKLQELFESEQDMTKALVEQSYKSALLGKILVRLLENYGTLTVDDITESLARMFELAAYVPGLELGKYQSKTEEIIAELNKDAASKVFLDQALNAMRNSGR